MAGPGDDKVVTGSQQGFEERLTGLRAGVTVADKWGRGREIVAVGACQGARVDLVEPEKADHAEGQPPKRCQGSDSDATPEEGGTARGSLHALREEASEVCERDLDRRRLATYDRFVGYLGDNPAELIQLPLQGGVNFEELLDRVRHGVAPLGSGARPPHVVGDRLQTCDEIGQSAGEGDVAALHSEGSDPARSQVQVVIAHGHSDEQPVDGRPPRVGAELGREAPGPAVWSVEAPAHVGLLDPVRNRAKSVAVEFEASPDRRQAR